jgi:hypothetical protein
VDGFSLSLVFLPKIKDNLTEETEVLLVTLQLLQKFNEALFDLFSSSIHSASNNNRSSIPLPRYTTVVR